MQAAGVRFHQKQDVEKDCLFKKITSPKQAIKNGIGFLTEDRRGEGLVLEMDILNNLNLPILDKMTTPIVNFLHKRQPAKGCSGQVVFNRSGYFYSG